MKTKKRKRVVVSSSDTDTSSDEGEQERTTKQPKNYTTVSARNALIRLPLESSTASILPLSPEIIKKRNELQTIWSRFAASDQYQLQLFGYKIEYVIENREPLERVLKSRPGFFWCALMKGDSALSVRLLQKSGGRLNLSICSRFFASLQSEKEQAQFQSALMEMYTTPSYNLTTAHKCLRVALAKTWIWYFAKGTVTLTPLRGLAESTCKCKASFNWNNLRYGSNTSKLYIGTVDITFECLSTYMRIKVSMPHGSKCKLKHKAVRFQYVLPFSMDDTIIDIVLSGNEQFKDELRNLFLEKLQFPKDIYNIVHEYLVMNRIERKPIIPGVRVRPRDSARGGITTVANRISSGLINLSC